MAPPKKASTSAGWQAIALAAIAALPPTLIAAAAFWQAAGAKTQSIETHKAVNSRMDAMLILVTKGAGDAATLKEKAAQQTREGEAAITEAGKPNHRK
jgi:hypothetical protein